MREEKASANHGLGSHMYINIAYPKILSTQGFFLFFFLVAWVLPTKGMVGGKNIMNTYEELGKETDATGERGFWIRKESLLRFSCSVGLQCLSPRTEGARVCSLGLVE